jgi:hypothetical protein
MPIRPQELSSHPDPNRGKNEPRSRRLERKHATQISTCPPLSPATIRPSAATFPRLRVYLPAHEMDSKSTYQRPNPSDHFSETGDPSVTNPVTKSIKPDPHREKTLRQPHQKSTGQMPIRPRELSRTRTEPSKKPTHKSAAQTKFPAQILHKPPTLGAFELTFQRLNKTSDRDFSDQTEAVIPQELLAVWNKSRHKIHRTCPPSGIKSCGTCIKNPRGRCPSAPENFPAPKPHRAKNQPTNQRLKQNSQPRFSPAFHFSAPEMDFKSTYQRPKTAHHFSEIETIPPQIPPQNPSNQTQFANKILRQSHQKSMGQMPIRRRKLSRTQTKSSKNGTQKSAARTKIS